MNPRNPTNPGEKCPLTIAVDLSVITATLCSICLFLTAIGMFTVFVMLPTQGLPEYAHIARFSLGAIIALFCLIPAIALARAVAAGDPYLRFNDKGVQMLRLPFMRQYIAWDDVDELGGKGIWVVLVDRKARRHKLIESLTGAKGMWVATPLVKGGSAPLADAIRAYRPDLFQMKAKA